MARRPPVSYLLLSPRSSCYYFRIRIPRFLHGILPRKELKYSLKVTDDLEAQCRAVRIAKAAKTLFRYLEQNRWIMKELTPAEIDYLVCHYMLDLLKHFEDYRVVHPGPRNPDEYEWTLKLLDENLSAAKQELINSDYENSRDGVDDILDHYGMNGIDRDSYTFKKLSREFLKARIKVLEVEKKREVGDYTEDLEEDLSKKLSVLRPPLGMRPEIDESSLIKAHVENMYRQPDAPRATPSESLEALIKKYSSEQKKSGAWKEKTESEVLSSLELLVEFLGNLPVRSIDHAVMRSYKEALMRLPANIRKTPAYRDKSIDEILQLDVAETMSTTTINKYLDRASALFRWAVRNSYMDRNPAEALQLSDSRRPDEARDPFDDEDLLKIFHSREYLEDKHRHSYCYWVPILALFTGMRLNEICQLHLSDIYQSEDGTYVIHVNEEDEKGLKNKSSVRIVPIHDFLLQELNLLSYVEKLKSESQTRLFPELRQRRDSYGQTVTKWFARYRERCGIAAEKYRKTFHSFRHTVAKRLREANVPDSQIAQLVGHEEGSETSRYGKRQSPRLLKERAVDQLSYGIDLSHLKNSKYVHR